MFKKLTSMVSFNLLGTISTFVFGVLMTHLLSVHDYGILSKWLTDLGFVGVFFTLGLNTSLMYFVRKGESIEDNVGRNIVVYSIMLILAIIFSSLFLNNGLVYNLTLYITIYSFSLNQVMRSYFQYHENFKLYNIFTPIRPILVLIAFSLIAFFITNKFTVNESLFIYAICAVISTVIIGGFYFKESFVSFKFSHFFNISYYTYGIKSILNTLLSLGLYSSCVYMLRFLADFESVGLFFAASSISKVVWVIPDSAGNILYPLFLKAKTQEDEKKVVDNMIFYAQVVFLLNLICLVGFFIVGKFIVAFLYNEDYASIYLPILILLVGNQGMVYYKLISRYLAARNKWKPLYLSLSVAIIVALSLNYLLIPKYGMLGATVASCLSFWACGLVASIFVKGSLLGFFNIWKPIRYLKDNYDKTAIFK